MKLAGIAVEHVIVSARSAFSPPCTINPLQAFWLTTLRGFVAVVTLLALLALTLGCPYPRGVRCIKPAKLHGATFTAYATVHSPHIQARPLQA